MIIRRKLFSKSERDDKKRDKNTSRKNDNKSIAIGAGTVAAGTVGNAILGKKHKEYLKSPSTEEGEKCLIS